MLKDNYNYFSGYAIILTKSTLPITRNRGIYLYIDEEDEIKIYIVLNRNNVEMKFLKDLVEPSELNDIFKKIKESINNNPSIPVKLPEKLLDQILKNCKTQSFPPFHYLFEEQVKIQSKLCSNHKAISSCYYDGEVKKQKLLTYNELNEIANKLARYLLKAGENWNPEKIIGEDNTPRIGIAFDNCIEAVVCILATMKAGFAFVPLSVDYTPEKLHHCIQRVKLSLIITKKKFENKFLSINDTQIENKSRIEIYQNIFKTIENTESTNLQNIDIKKDQLAYIMFSSGTTGAPKGICVAHRGLCNPVMAVKKAFDIKNQDKVGWYSSLTFDASLLDIMTPLGCGATLVIIPEKIRKDWSELLNYIKETKINIITLVPSVLTCLKDTYEKDTKNSEKILPDLHGLISTGEKGKLELFKYWAKHKPRTLINGYGPTEATICSSLGKFDAKSDVLDIGQPITGLTWYYAEVSNFNKNLYPRELHDIKAKISSIETNKNLAKEYVIVAVGENVALGYLQTNMQTQPDYLKRFNAALYNTDKQPIGNGYITGDRVRLIKGKIEYIGRIDRQLKIFGKLVHCEAIENALINYTYHGDKLFEYCILDVLDKKSKSAHTELLHAYLGIKQTDIAQNIFHNEHNSNLIHSILHDILFTLIKQQLFQVVPVSFRFFYEWPAGSNKAISKITAEHKSGENNHTEIYQIKSDLPFKIQRINSHKIEKTIEYKIEKIWQGNLNLTESIPLDLNYYYMGGNSISVTSLKSKLREIGYPTNEFYSHFNVNPTLRSLILRVKLATDGDFKKQFYESTIAAQPSGNQVVPIIFIHSVMGKADEDYKYITENWRENWGKCKYPVPPWMQINSPALTYPGYAVNSLYQLAFDYIDFIENNIQRLGENYVNYKGPYILVGYSAGGTIAYQMAEILQKNNVKVAVIMLDTLSPEYYQKISNDNYADEIFKLLKFTYEKKNSGQFKGDVFDSLNLPEELRNHSKSHQLEFCYHRIKEEMQSHVGKYDDDYDRCFALKLFRTLLNTIPCQLSYKPQKINYAYLFAIAETKEKVDRYWRVKNNHATDTNCLMWQNKLNIESSDVIPGKHLDIVGDTQDHVEWRNKKITPKLIEKISYFNEVLKLNFSVLAKKKEYKQYDEANDREFKLTSIRSRDNNQTTNKFEKIVLIGAAFSGKTSFCQKILYNWAKGKDTKYDLGINLTQYELVYYFDFREYTEKKHNEISSLKSFLNSNLPFKFNILFVFDNYQSLNEASSLGKLIIFCSNANCSIILTSTKSITTSPINKFSCSHLSRADINNYEAADIYDQLLSRWEQYNIINLFKNESGLLAFIKILINNSIEKENGHPPYYEYTSITHQLQTFFPSKFNRNINPYINELLEIGLIKLSGEQIVDINNDYKNAKFVFFHPKAYEFLNKQLGNIADLANTILDVKSDFPENEQVTSAIDRLVKYDFLNRLNSNDIRDCANIIMPSINFLGENVKAHSNRAMLESIDRYRIYYFKNTDAVMRSSKDKKKYLCEKFPSSNQFNHLLNLFTNSQKVGYKLFGFFDAGCKKSLRSTNKTIKAFIDQCTLQAKQEENRPIRRNGGSHKLEW